MPEIDWSFVSVVISSATAVIAIVAPVVTAVYTAKSQERSKKMELYAPRVYEALEELSVSYGQLDRHLNYSNEDEFQAALAAAARKSETFRMACFKVMALVPGQNIQQQIMEILKSSNKDPFTPSDKHDRMFCQLMSDTNAYVLSLKVKKEKKYTKN